MKRTSWVFAVAIVLLTAGCQSVVSDRTRLTEVPPSLPYSNAPGATHVPAPAHVVIVVEENKAGSTIIGNRNAPYINQLAKAGALFVHASGVAHPSQPNYLALFSGQTNADADDCPEKTVPPTARSLGGVLIAAHRSVAGYAEGMPQPGFTGCSAGRGKTTYARKHAPWVNFSDVPPALSLPLTAMPPPDGLPTVSFVIPGLGDDMHSGSIAAADGWLRTHVGPIIVWSMTHDSLVIITWDESDTYFGNSIPLVFVGARVKPGNYSESVDHYRVLRTIEDFYGLPYLGHSADVAPIDDVWKTP